MANDTNTTTKTPKFTALGIVKREGKKSFWTKIGAAWENSDGSINLNLNFIPFGSAECTIQLRPYDEHKDAE